MNPLRSQITNRKIEKLYRINQLIRLLDNDITPIAVSCFLYVASHDNCHKQVMEESLNLSTSSGSRNTDFLTDLRRKYPNGKRKPGLNLITKTPDPENRRRTILTLTSKGKDLTSQISDIYEAVL